AAAAVEHDVDRRAGDAAGVDRVVPGAAIDGDRPGRDAGTVQVARDGDGIAGIAEVEDNLLDVGGGDRGVARGRGAGLVGAGQDLDAEMRGVGRIDDVGRRRRGAVEE